MLNNGAKLRVLWHTKSSYFYARYIEQDLCATKNVDIWVLKILILIKQNKCWCPLLRTCRVKRHTKYHQACNHASMCPKQSKLLSPSLPDSRVTLLYHILSKGFCFQNQISIEKKHQQKCIPWIKLNGCVSLFIYHFLNCLFRVWITSPDSFHHTDIYLFDI